MDELARRDPALAGELVSPAHELVDEFVLTLGEGAKVARTAKTYRSACERFAAWLVATHGRSRALAM